MIFGKGKKKEKTEEKKEESVSLEKICNDSKLYEDLSRILPLNPHSIEVPGKDSPSVKDVEDHTTKLKNEGNRYALTYSRYAIVMALWKGTEEDVQRTYKTCQEITQESYEGIMCDIGRAQKVVREFYSKKIEELKKTAEATKQSETTTK